VAWALAWMDHSTGFAVVEREGLRTMVAIIPVEKNERNNGGKTEFGGDH
jgi:hypothetical protein